MRTIRCECGRDAQDLGWVPGRRNMVRCPHCGEHVKEDRRPNGHRSLAAIMQNIKADSGSIGDAKVESFGAQVKKEEDICTHGFPKSARCPFCR